MRKTLNLAEVREREREKETEKLLNDDKSETFM